MTYPSPADVESRDTDSRGEATQALQRERSERSPIVSISPKESAAGHLRRAWRRVPELLDTVRAKLHALALTVADRDFLWRHFIGGEFNFIDRRPETGWTLVRKRPLSDSRIIAHLDGRCIIGTGARWDAERRRFMSRYVAIDIDHTGDVDDLLARYDAVVGALGRPSYVFSSSASKGLHVYYLLRQDAPLHLLRNPDGSDGVVMTLLRFAGLREAPGRCEVYPRGAYRARGVQNRLRTPFGTGARLLAHDTLLPMSRAGTADLVTARELFEAGKIPVTDVGRWLERAAKVASSDATPTRAAETPGRVASARGTAGPIDVESIRRDGLTGPGQLNRATSALAFDCKRRGLTVASAHADVILWLDRHHNGMSRTYNRSPEAARREAGAIVDRVYARATGRAWAPLPGLSEWEVSQLLDRLGADEPIDPKTGEVLNRFRLDSLAFELTRRAKQWIVTEGQRVYDELRAAHPDADTGADDFSSLMRAAVQHFWPDTTQLEFVVPIPYALRLTIDGVSEAAQLSLWRSLGSTDAFRVVTGASAWAHRAARYALVIDFGTRSDRPIAFRSLEAALTHGRDPALRRKRMPLYSRHYRSRIHRAPTADVQIEQTNGLSGFLGWITAELRKVSGSRPAEGM